MADALTVPNLISVARIAAVPVFLWLLLGRDDPVAAAWVLAAIGASDWLDGFLARKLDQMSRLGAILDPVADRIAVTAAVLAGWAAGVVPPLLAAPLALRESLVAGVSVWLAARRLPRIEVRPLGKAATFLLYVAVPAFYLSAAGLDLRVLGWVVGGAGTILYYLVLIPYGGDVVGNLRRTEGG